VQVSQKSGICKMEARELDTRWISGTGYVTFGVGGVARVLILYSKVMIMRVPKAGCG
jgi:hypothetical protein